MTIALLALLDRDPAVGILATADLREQRAEAAGIVAPAPWVWQHNPSTALDGVITAGDGQLVYAHYDSDDGIGLIPEEGEHIAAEANPAHALAAVRRWRATVAWWQSVCIPDPHGTEEVDCQDCALWHATVNEARAYLGGAP